MVILKEIKFLFKTKFKDNNIMTPDVIGYGNRGKYAYELSTGEGFGGETIYGITVIDIYTQEHNHDLSGMYPSMEKVSLALKLLNNGEKLVC